MTLYLQNYLAQPDGGGARYLPLTVAVFLVAPIAGAPLSKVHARVMITLGLLGGRRPPADGGRRRDGRVDRASSRVHRRRRRHRTAQPGDRVDVAWSVVPKEQSGMASGINDTFRQVGVSVGVAVWGAIFLGAGPRRWRSHGPRGRPPRGLGERSLRQPRPGAHAGRRVRAQVGDAAREGQRFNDIAVYGAVLAFAAAIAAFFLVRECDIERGALVEEVEPEVVEHEPAAIPEPVAA